MDWIALLKTVGLCLVSIVIEAVSASKAGKAWFENLKQPRYAFGFSFWYVVGGLYYVICGIIAYRQFRSSSALFTLPVILLASIMIINGLTNFILFKVRSLKIFYFVLYPFVMLFIALIVALYPSDIISVGVATVYLLWLVYDLYYFRNLWKINTQ